MAAQVYRRMVVHQNFLRIDDERFVDALIEEALPEDRVSFRKYLSARPFGLGAISAGPGFGKTSSLSIGTLGMLQTFGKMYGSGPTHVAVDNFAVRIAKHDRNVVERYNKDKPAGSFSSRAHCKIIVRGYKFDDEVGAFMNLLRDPHLEPRHAAPKGLWRGQSKWQPNLSLVSWLLVLLRCPAFPELHDDASPVLRVMQAQIDGNDRWKSLRDVATRTITWEEYEKGGIVDERDVKISLAKILEVADMVCTTPALSTKGPYDEWKNQRAKAVALDEAGNLNRADLYTVWGNTLLPCLIAGDDDQIPPPS
ncbi:hypothetical protein PT974_09965 [Cladobotryum mycophilum]|uniref:DNA2/NAM7 helicase helicase domain-containing protein n=1 Tax=Cladobotryum mycophilum TaxID=491253 RepID=A0ABR0S8I7_9HYPO